MKVEKAREGFLIDDFRVLIDQRSVDVGGSWQINNENDKIIAYDMKTIKFFYERILEFHAPIVMDIGASTGSFCLLAKRVKGMRVYAFEPNPTVFEILNSNIALNNLQDKIKTFQIALSDKKGTAILKCPIGRSMSGLACIGNPLCYSDFIEVEVPVNTIDEVLTENQIQTVDLIKIDTEGCELFIIKGGEKFIKENTPDILLEYSKTCQFGYKPREIKSLLKSWGYDFINLSQEDMYFFNSQKRKSFLSLNDQLNHILNEIYFKVKKFSLKNIYNRSLKFIKNGL